MQKSPQPNKTLSVILPIELYNRIEELAKSKGYLTSQFARLALKERCEMEQPK